MNGIGVSDSGGVSVLEKLIKECLEVSEVNNFTFMLTSSKVVSSLVARYETYDTFNFRVLKFKNYLHRLYFENVKFKKIVSQSDIDLVYNFTGSAQFFLECPQLVKMHNLLFYSKKLDRCYRDSSNFILWLRQVFFKGVVLRFMLARSKYIEIQSKHVKECLSDYINTKNKCIFIKSDIEVIDDSFKEPKNYDFSKKIKFLYIVGPHFNYKHKNFLDFTKGMMDLLRASVDFEINITLTRDQLAASDSWDVLLNSKTNFYGYISDPKDMEKLFCDNTILISTSIIETLGLHVVEAIQHGILTITPNENYANEVYGKCRYNYELFDHNSLSKTVMDMFNDESVIPNKIVSQQVYLRENEMSKFNSIVDVFSEILNAQK